MPRKLIMIIAIAAAVPAFAAAQGVRVGAEAEFGWVKVLYHTYRLGATADGNATFDFVNHGGQEILFPFQRYTAEAAFGKRTFLRLLYQPLELHTQVGFRADTMIDGVTFPAGTPMDMVYSFPFWRATWLYRILDGAFSLDAGAALQLRNASIRFTRLDGAPGVSISQNLGPVPALALAAAWTPVPWLELGMDATGLWASSAIINGANFQFEGSILDASLRSAVSVGPGSRAYLNLRFLGGTAAGISGYARDAWSESVSPESENRLATLALTLGLRLDPGFSLPR